MPRLDRDRLKGARFPVVKPIETRFADLDVQGHINNGAAVLILQEARAHFHRVARLHALHEGLRVMVAGLTVEYAAEMHHPDPLEIHSGVLSIGRTSYIIGQMARQGGRDCLYAEVAVALAGPEGPAPLPAALRESFEALRIL